MMAADLPMQDVRAQYAELKATLSTFQASVGDCLERAEAEFLQAYRAHMVEVHRELQQLRRHLPAPACGGGWQQPIAPPRRRGWARLWVLRAG